MKKPFYKKKWFIVLAIIFAIGGMISTNENAEDKKIDYKVISKEDLTFGGTIRYGYHVVVEGKPDIKDLEKISKEIIKEEKKNNKFNAISIQLYDYEEYIGNGYTLGKTTYAPDGKWEEANTIKTGEYKTMDYKFELREKDWDRQLTKEEVKIYKSWKDLYKNEMTEEDTTKEVAKKFNISEEEVNDIIVKQSIWTTNDKTK